MFFRKKPEVGGEIAAYGLETWWVRTFTAKECEYISDRYQPMGVARKRTLTEGHGFSTPDNPHHDRNRESLLSSIPSWLEKPEDRPLQRKWIEAALPLAQRATTRHFLLLALIENYYRCRETEAGALDKAIRSCQQAIKLAPEFKREWFRDYPQDKPPKGRGLPKHPGFEQLAIIREKQGDFEGAIKLSRAAKQQGWAGDWDKRITRCQSKC